MEKTVDISRLEDTQTALESILAFTEMLLKFTEPFATISGVHQPTFKAVALNLFTLHELVNNLHADITRTVDDAYR